jgi:iron complex outermembrane receptor protein
MPEIKNNMKLKRLLGLTLTLSPLLSSICYATQEQNNETSSKLTLDAITISAEQPTGPFESSTLIKNSIGIANDGAELLKQSPGVSVIRQGGTASDPLLRGLGGTRLNISIDGVPFGGVCNHRMDPATAYVSPGTFDALSLLKGPQSVRNGNSIAGTVNFDREEIRDTKPGIRTYGSYLYGSFDQQNLSVDSSAGFKYGYLNYTHNNARGGNYSDGDGREVDLTFYDTSNDRGAIGFTPDEDTLIEISGLRSDGQIANATIHMDVSKLDRENYSFHLKKENISPWIKSLDIRYSYTEVDHDMDNFTLRPLRPFHEFILMGQFWKRHFAKAELVSELTPDIELLSGFEYRNDSYDANAASGFIEFETIPKKRPFNHILDFDNIAAYSELKYQLNDNLRWVAGIRGDTLGTRTGLMHAAGETSSLVLSGSNQHRRQTLLAGFLRAEYAFDELPVLLSVGYGHAERAADYWEVYSMDGFSLNAEKNNEIDAMLSYKSEKITAELSAFYSHISDFILVNRGDSAANIKAQRIGGELSLGYNFTEDFGIASNLSYTHADNLTQDVPLAQTPPLEGNIELKYQHDAFSGSVNTRLVNSQDRIHTNFGNVLSLDSTPTAGFIVTSLQLGYTPHPLVKFKFGIDNLFDKTYNEHLNRSASASAAGPSISKLNEPGRAYWGRISIDFDYPDI